LEASHIHAYGYLRHLGSWHTGAHDVSGGSYAADKASQPGRHPSRRLLQGSANAAAAVSAGAAPAKSPPPPPAVVIHPTGDAAAPGPVDAAAPPDNPGNFAGAQFGFQAGMMHFSPLGPHPVCHELTTVASEAGDKDAVQSFVPYTVGD
jgi:hypothetical protein